MSEAVTVPSLMMMMTSTVVDKSIAKERQHTHRHNGLQAYGYDEL